MKFILHRLLLYPACGFILYTLQAQTNPEDISHQIRVGKQLFINIHRFDALNMQYNMPNGSWPPYLPVAISYAVSTNSYRNEKDRDLVASIDPYRVRERKVREHRFHFRTHFPIHISITPEAGITC